jgi:hypothetical protein
VRAAREVDLQARINAMDIMIDPKNMLLITVADADG